MFKNKVVVVTGGTDGIGKALVEQLVAHGALAATCGRSSEKLEMIRNEITNSHLLALQCDVSNEDSSREFIENVIRHFGRIDILINNAGISMRALFKDVNIDTMKQVMNVNFWGTVHCTKYALDSIRKNNGVIAAISSIAGHRGLPGRGGYSASKFALNGWMESLRTELLGSGTDVIWISPGFTQSNVRKAALTKNAEAQGESPLNESKLMTADECATHILKAIDQRKRNKILTFQGKQTVFMSKFFPSLTDRLTRKFFFRDGKLIK